MILQQEKPDDYVIATGTTTSIREFVDMAFRQIGCTLSYKGKGMDETGVLETIDKDIFIQKVGENYYKNFSQRIGEVLVAVDAKYFRPTEVDFLLGDARKAQEKLGWKPEYDLSALVNEMMESDMQLMKKDGFLKENGYTILNYFE